MTVLRALPSRPSRLHAGLAAAADHRDLRERGRDRLRDDRGGHRDAGGGAGSRTASPYYAWSFSLFLIGMLFATVVAGRLSDRIGPAKPLLAGLAIFAGRPGRWPARPST